MPNGDIPEIDQAHFPSVFDIDVVRVARVYAEALLHAAERAGKVDVVGDQLAALAGDPLRRQDGQTDPVTLLSSTAIPRARRDEITRKALAGRVDDLVLNFVLVLNDHNRLDILRAAAAVYKELMDERARRVRVRVRSAVPLTDGEREQVRELTRQLFGLNAVLAESVDPARIGGLRIQVGDEVID